MKVRIATAALLTAAAFLHAAPMPPATPAPAPAAAAPPPSIEVCFVLDTTGSMSGLIDGAKRKIWSIANAIVKDNPKASLKIALVAYRDRGDTYITKVSDLTDDLDNMYKELSAFEAGGGGDEPESVNQALDEAVNKISWSPITLSAKRILFLVGDAPPHMDYPDDVKYPTTVALALQKHITIDTVQCGAAPNTATVWQDIAKTSQGSYFALPQDGAMAAIATPQDKQLADLNGQLAQTVLPYGSARQQTAVAAKASSFGGMPAEAAADRAAYNVTSGGRGVQGAGDLVQDIKSDKELLAKTKDEDLPAALKNLSPQERQKKVDELLAKRESLNEQIAKVAKERQDYLQTHTPKTQGDAFDTQVIQALHALTPYPQ